MRHWVVLLTFVSMPAAARPLLGPDAAVPTHLTGRGRQLQSRFHEELGHYSELSPVQDRFGIVIPARNEAGQIQSTLASVARALGPHAASADVIVIDNASTDQTAERVRAWSQQNPHLPVTLLKEPEPGKVRAILRAEDVFKQRGEYPEWIVQLDADTALRPGLIEKAVERSIEHDFAAFDALPHFLDRRPHPVDFASQVGHPEDFAPAEYMAGAFFLMKPEAYFAGHRAILNGYPQTAAEDALLSKMLDHAGLARHTLPYYFATLGTPDPEKREAQLLRRETATAQLLRLYPGAHLQLSQSSKARAEEAADKADQAGRYSWIPPR